MKTSGVPISAFSKRVQEQIAEQLYAGKQCHKNAIVIPDIPGDPKRLRQSSKGPNKTEAAFEAYLLATYPGWQVLTQAVTLKLANGVRYTPDFFTPWTGPESAPTFWETKGGYFRDDAAVKLKVAASLHEWAVFNLVTKRSKKQGGGWQIERVLP